MAAAVDGEFRVAPPGERRRAPVREWRADLQGARDVRLTVEYEDYLWSGLYPASAEIRAELGEAGLEGLYAVLAQSVGHEMARVAELEVSLATP